MRAMVLCAGLGTRMGALTADRPKALLEVGGQPLLARTLRWLAREGVEEVVVNLHHYGEQIVQTIADGSEHGVRVRYMREERLLGTAGSVVNARPLLDDDPEVIVVYGDLLLDEPLAPLIARHRQAEALATILVHRRRASNSIVDVDDDGRVIRFIERPAELVTTEHWVNSGVAVLGVEIWDLLPTTVPADLPVDVYVPLVSTGRLFAHPLVGERIAIDSPRRLAAAEAAVLGGSFGGVPGGDG